MGKENERKMIRFEDIPGKKKLEFKGRLGIVYALLVAGVQFNLTNNLFSFI